MEDVGNEKGGAPEQPQKAIRRLIRISRFWEVLTFTAVILVSPASFVLGLPFGIGPAVWLTFWLHWTVVFIVLAIIIALLGFEAASSFRLKAERLGKRPEAGGISN